MIIIIIIYYYVILYYIILDNNVGINKNNYFGADRKNIYFVFNK